LCFSQYERKKRLQHIFRPHLCGGGLGLRDLLLGLEGALAGKDEGAVLVKLGLGDDDLGGGDANVNGLAWGTSCFIQQRVPVQ